MRLLSSDGSEEETARAEQQQGEILGCVFFFFFLSIPCFPTLSFLITVISAHWSRSKCFSRSGELGVCVMVCVQEEEEEEEEEVCVR